MKGRLIGFIILAVIVAAAILYQFVIREGSDGEGLLNNQPVIVRGVVEGEKAAFLDDSRVREILRSRYDIEVDYRTSGSIQMINTDSKDGDFVWPSSQVAVGLFRMRRSQSVNGETIFNTPLVIYTWAEIASALEEAGYVEQDDAGVLRAPMESLIGMVLEGTSWSDLGVDSLYGSVAISTTDPTASASGNLFAGLVANVLDESVVSDESLSKVMGRVIRLFGLQGDMESSTGSLFDRYVEQGIGPYPIIIGYENQIIEYSRQHPDLWPEASQQMRIIYPVPTVVSEHTIIPITENGERLAEALRDDEIQQIAWEQHGFRTASENNPASLGLSGMPTTVTQVTRMPVAEVMQTITTALQ